eukprot:UN07707
MYHCLNNSCRYLKIIHTRPVGKQNCFPTCDNQNWTSPPCKTCNSPSQKP